MSTRPPLLSVVVPVLNEEATVALLLSDLARLTTPHEVIVVNGGSTDRTADVSRAAGARVVSAERGRGVQLRAGAEKARAPLLLFLHADARLDQACLALLDEIAVARPPCAMAFRLRIDASGVSYRLIEWGTNVRSRLLALPYGDQGLVVRRVDYVEAGGYPPILLMEDVALVRALRRVTKMHLLDAAVSVSDRRWRAQGPVRRTLKNWLLMIRYLTGTPPDRLARRYGPERTAVVEGTSLIVFAKTPTIGRVKTRLTPPLSPNQAAAVYEASLKDVVRLARRTGMRVQILYAGGHDAGGNHAGDFFARAFPEIDRLPQAGGDLGQRMQGAFEGAFRRGARRAIIIGSDAPTLPLGELDAAARAVRPGAAVLGPALDGGYYLVGLHSSAWPRARLMFRDMAWSTGSVLRDTIAKLSGTRLDVELLSPWYDIDRVEDLRIAAVHADPHSNLGALLAKTEYSALL